MVLSITASISAFLAKLIKEPGSFSATLRLLQFQFPGVEYTQD